MHVIVSLSDDLSDLEKARDRLLAEKEEMEKETLKMKERFNYLYSHIFQSLRNEHGEPYDHNHFSLQQSSDGNVFLVPRKITTNGIHSNKGSMDTDKKSGGKKRKATD